MYLKIKTSYLYHMKDEYFDDVDDDTLRNEIKSLFKNRVVNQ